MNANKFAGVLSLVASAMAVAMNLDFMISTLDMPLSVHTLERINRITPILFAGSIVLAISGAWFLQKRPMQILRFVGHALFLVICGQMFGVVFLFLLSGVWHRALLNL
jgi:hypothetical protein